MKDIENRVTVVSAYHEQTKHHLHSFGRKPRYTDWDNPPQPFRIYEGSARIPLLLGGDDDAQPYSVLYTGRQDGGTPVDSRSIGRFFELSLGLSAWKKRGPWKWSLRMNPSSGNLHPTEGYVVLPETDASPACLAHYNPLFHALEVRARLGEQERTARRHSSQISPTTTWVCLVTRKIPSTCCRRS